MCAIRHILSICRACYSCASLCLGSVALAGCIHKLKFIVLPSKRNCIDDSRGCSQQRGAPRSTPFTLVSCTMISPRCLMLQPSLPLQEHDRCLALRAVASTASRYSVAASAFKNVFVFRDCSFCLSRRSVAAALTSPHTLEGLAPDLRLY